MADSTKNTQILNSNSNTLINRLSSISDKILNSINIPQILSNNNNPQNKLIQNIENIENNNNNIINPSNNFKFQSQSQSQFHKQTLQLSDLSAIATITTEQNTKNNDFINPQTNLNLLSTNNINNNINNNLEATSCEYTVNGATFLGSKFSSTTIQLTSGSYQYFYSPCRDDLPCTASQVSYMSIQVTSGGGDCIAYLSKWDNSKNPSFSNSNGGTFTFTYNNGQCGGSGSSSQTGTFIIKYICDSTSTELYNTATLTNPSQCKYEMSIKTQYACATGNTNNNNNLISGGSIFLIILIVILFLYCVGGYGLSVYKENKENGNNENWKDIKKHTPHLTFWCILPKYFITGCIVSKEFIIGMYHKYIKKDGTYNEKLDDGDDE